VADESSTGSGVAESNVTTSGDDPEVPIAIALRQNVRRALAPGYPRPASEKEDDVTIAVRSALTQIGQLYRTETGMALFFRTRDRRLYEISDRADSAFGQLVTHLADLSVTNTIVKRSLDRVRARVSQEAPTVQVHGLAYSSADADVVAINDFGGGMWYRQRGGRWTWQPNGHEGILFWTPPEFVDPWCPEFTGDEEACFQWFLEQAHFAEDILTVQDQRLLLRALLVTPFFPSHCRVRPIQAHLGLSQQRQHDTGKTMAGKLLGALFVGRNFQPTPAITTGERGEEAVQLALMHQPFVLLDNVDTDIRWLNDFLCTYATGARPTKRKLYSDATQVHIEYRGRLCITSRKPKFNRADTASRVIPLRFRPIAADERKTERDLLGPVLAQRGLIWAGLLTAIARVQDALPHLQPPAPSSRLADFEELGWRIAAVFGQEAQWESAMVRLQAAQAGFALEDEPLVPVLRALLAQGDVPDQPTSQLFTRCQQEAIQQGRLVGFPMDAAAFTKRLHELREALESQLDVRISTRTLHGYTHVRIDKGATAEVSEVTEDTPSLVVIRG
jgi:hypothetical protein